MQGRKNQYLKFLETYNFNELAKNEKNLKVKIHLLAIQQIKELLKSKEIYLTT